MAILVGMHPGGRNSFAISALFWTGRLPALLIGSRAYSGVNAVLYDIMSVFGEWGELTAAAIASPLTWSGTPDGRRDCDRALKELVPAWAPSNWLRAPNVLPGSVGIQGPALAWSLAVEAKQGNLPKHQIYETHPRLSLGRFARDLREPLCGYRQRSITKDERTKYVTRLVDRLVDPGIIRIETDTPQIPEELEALVCATTALAVAFPQCGLITREMSGGDIRPVGRRSVILLEALP
ncbi:MAG: DUF429 domain-containing protein [Caldilineaceae bacterium]|nr:DUF429 domain-containing protein [Caldilineaceae bacterium]